ncbi:PspC domain-containing protein [Enemella sp. A6]|uniref:PspC domain-containing protein n=1 Tax=Enemella sp. A6 TaxID=3440152 RepID=UPI003EBC80F3
MSIKRSRTDRVLGGVCGGLAEATGINAWILRIIWLLIPGPNIIAYLICWAVISD